MAREPNVALTAEPGQRVTLVEPELPLLWRGDQLDHVLVLDVPELERGLHEVVARVQVARVLDRERQPARLRVHAQARGLAVPVRERHVVISGIVNFAWLPWYPVWSITMIAICVAVIWALTAHGRDIVE